MQTQPTKNPGEPKGEDQGDPNGKDQDEPKPKGKGNQESLIHKYSPAIIGALVSIGIFFATVTVSGHQRDHDVKQQLVESISTVVSDATSYAEEVGSGEIVHEGTPSQPASAVIQQRFDQAWQDWRRGDELVRLQINTYFPNPARNELNTTWNNVEIMVNDLIFLGGQVNNRTSYVHTLQRSFADAGKRYSLTSQESTVLGETPGPACYISGKCPNGFQGEFLDAINGAVGSIQSYLLNDLTAKIQNRDTIFQPWICVTTPVCNV